MRHLVCFGAAVALAIPVAAVTWPLVLRDRRKCRHLRGRVYGPLVYDERGGR